MKIARSTKERIAQIKSEAAKNEAELGNLLARLEEHSGTKRICRPLKDVIDRLQAWRTTNHY